MTRMPGAVWRPIPVSPTRPRRIRGRGVCLHVAVSEAASLFDFFSTASVDSHFYVTKSGVIEQYVDTDLVAYANLEGNSTLISVETQGGVTDPHDEPWTDAQLHALAAIVKWAHDVDGVPLQEMQNSLPASRGVGWHRLGVNPYRAPGGELWSAAYGKECPGAAKIAQVAQVLRLAASPTPTPVPAPVEDDDMKLNAYRVKGTAAVFAGGPGIWQWVRNNTELRQWQAEGTLGSIVDVPDQAALDRTRALWLSAVVDTPLDSDNDPRGDWGLVDRLPAMDAGVQELLKRTEPPAA